MHTRRIAHAAELSMLGGRVVGRCWGSQEECPGGFEGVSLAHQMWTWLLFWVIVDIILVLVCSHETEYAGALIFDGFFKSLVVAAGAFAAKKRSH